MPSMKHRSGHFVVWTSSSGQSAAVGKLTVWGAGLQNVAMHCKLQGHEGCKRVGKTLDLQADGLETWLFQGVGVSGAEHMNM